jgi:hypothetical protein
VLLRRTTALLVLALALGTAGRPPPTCWICRCRHGQDTALLGSVGARPDRVLVSVVPGPVTNDEVVWWAWTPSVRRSGCSWSSACC